MRKSATLKQHNPRDHSRTRVIAHSGSEIDISGNYWLLSSQTSIDWGTFPVIPEEVLFATKEYIVNAIAKYSPRTVARTFTYLRGLLQLLEEDWDSIANEGCITFPWFGECRARLIDDNYVLGTINNYLDVYRRWYLWCADGGYTFFDAEAAFALDEIVIGGNPKGVAVLSHDPNRGPLRTEELYELLSKLEAAEQRDTLPLSNIVAARLFIAFGCNPQNLWLLNEEDFKPMRLSDGTELYELNIPSIKKPTVLPRTRFRARMLNESIGASVSRLIAQNRVNRAADPRWDTDRYDSPLFSAAYPTIRLLGTPFERDAYRVPAVWFNESLKELTSVLGIKSPLTGNRLNLHARRLRYTFAKRLVEEGASPIELAEALDHSDLQHVMVYYNSRSDIVRQLDDKLSLEFARRADTFMGKIIKRESDSIRGADPASRIYSFDPSNDGAIGNCGNLSQCGLFAPIACYTCQYFQPWADAPHALVLNHLVARRDRLINAGSDPKISQLYDFTIGAIAVVIKRCEELNVGKPSDGIK